MTLAVSGTFPEARKLPYSRQQGLMPQRWDDDDGHGPSEIGFVRTQFVARAPTRAGALRRGKARPAIAA